MVIHLISIFDEYIIRHTKGNIIKISLKQFNLHNSFN